jgi:hypothetical protein
MLKAKTQWEEAKLNTRGAKNKGNAGLAPHKASDQNKAQTGPDGNMIF